MAGTRTGTLQALLGHLDPWDLDAIWISHLHADHWITCRSRNVRAQSGWS